MERHGGIFWGLIERNSYWNDFVNVKSSSFIKCPTLEAMEDRKKKNKTLKLYFSERAQNRMKIHGSSDQYLTVRFKSVFAKSNIVSLRAVGCEPLR